MVVYKPLVKHPDICKVLNLGVQLKLLRITCVCLLELLLNLLCINKKSPKSKVNVKKNLHEEMVKKTR